MALTLIEKVSGWLRTDSGRSFLGVTEKRRSTVETSRPELLVKILDTEQVIGVDELVLWRRS